MVVASAVLITGLSIACSNENDAPDLQLLEKQSEQKNVLNEETAEFKSSLTSVLKQEQKRGINNTSEFSEGTIEFLKDKGLKMFKSHGFTEEDIRNVGAKTDEDIIFMATIFTAIVEHPANMPRVMKKSESGGETCYDGSSISDCLLRATGIKQLVTGCLTRAAALKFASKYVPLAGYAIFMADFANCMGWVNWW